MISSAVRKSFSSSSFCEKSIIVLVERIKNKTSFIVVRAGNQMWPIVVFEVATECTEVKFTCTPAILAKWKKISKSMVNVTSAYPGVITRKEHLPKTSKTPPTRDLVIAM